MDSTLVSDTEKRLGNEAFTKKDFKAAVEHFSKAIEASPSSHVLYSNRSAAYAGMGKYDKALEDADTVLKLNPQWPRGHGRRATALYFLGRLEESLEEYKTVLQSDPSNTQAKEAIKEVEAAIASATAAKQSSPKKNETEAKSKTNVSPKESSSASGKALAEKDRKEQEKLRELRELGLKMNRTERKAAADKEKELGNKDYKGKRFDSAIQHYKRATALFPDDVTYRSNMSAAYFEMGQMERCVEVCLGCVDDARRVGLFKLVPKLLTRLGTAYERLGDLDKSAEFYTKSFCALKCAETMAKLERVEEARAERDMRARIEPAEQCADWAAEERRGNELFRAGSYAEAAKCYEAAARSNPDNPVLHYNKAGALIKLGDLKGALAEAEKALEIDPSFCKF